MAKPLAVNPVDTAAAITVALFKSEAVLSAAIPTLAVSAISETTASTDLAIVEAAL